MLGNAYRCRDVANRVHSRLHLGEPEDSDQEGRSELTYPTHWDVAMHCGVGCRRHPDPTTLLKSHLHNKVASPETRTAGGCEL